MLSTSTGLTKTVYNPAALKAAQKTLLVSTSAVDNNEAQKKKQVSTPSSVQILHVRKLFCVYMSFQCLSQNRKEKCMLAATKLSLSLV